MKSTILAAAILITLTDPVAVLAEAPALTVKPLAADVAPIDVESSAQQAVAAGTVASVTGNPGQPCPMQGTGMMRKGMGQGGKGPACRKPGCDRPGGGQQNKHEQVVRRLDMIDARIAKIEAMLESLMQR